MDLNHKSLVAIWNELLLMNISRSETLSSHDATAVVQNFLKSMQGIQPLEGRNSQTFNVAANTLLDLLPPSTTIPVIDGADESFLERLLSQLPPELLNSQSDSKRQSLTDADSDVVSAGKAFNFERKKMILKKVLRSPQFSQNLISLTGALREGGLPAISDALGIPVANGGYTHTHGLAMGGNDATGAFMEGIKNLMECARARDPEQTS